MSTARGRILLVSLPQTSVATFCGLDAFLRSRDARGEPEGWCMGKLIYGPWGAEIKIEDRTLHHLRVVMVAKLRRGECFTLLWESTRDEGSGQNLFWFSPAVPIQMKFNGNHRTVINRGWIDALMLTANDGMGLRFVPEPSSPGNGS